MSEFYFDVGAWEKDVEARDRAEKEEQEAGTGGKRKRPSKKDLVGSRRFFPLLCLFLPGDVQRSCIVLSRHFVSFGALFFLVRIFCSSI